MEDDEIFDTRFAEEVALMDPGWPHIRRRRMKPEETPVQLGTIIFEGILDRRILPALDQAHRSELLSVHLNDESALKGLGISATCNKPAC